MSASAIALNRFGLGARPDEPAPADPQRWLLSQADRFEVLPPAWLSLPRTPALVDVWLSQQRAVRQAPEIERSGIRETYLRKARDAYVAAASARVNSSLQTPAPFIERLVHFWSNHFAVSVDKLLVMLLAVVRHPAMLLYLDQAQSIGPGSPAGLRARDRQQRRRGLNENLAREIMELHTLGVRSGYTQDDVTEFARALTGWTLPADDNAEPPSTTFRFVGALHEPGTRAAGARHPPRPGERTGHGTPHRDQAGPAFRCRRPACRAGGTPGECVFAHWR
jgi:uncharacterized protein (DUF1800 family)